MIRLLRWVCRLVAFLFLAALTFIIVRSVWHDIETHAYYKLPGGLIIGAIAITFLVRAAKVWFFSAAKSGG